MDFVESNSEAVCGHDDDFQILWDVLLHPHHKPRRKTRSIPNFGFLTQHMLEFPKGSGSVLDECGCIIDAETDQ